MKLKDLNYNFGNLVLVSKPKINKVYEDGVETDKIDSYSISVTDGVMSEPLKVKTLDRSVMKLAVFSRVNLVNFSFTFADKFGNLYGKCDSVEVLKD